MWIESLNTVMDDNKVLTLVSQERIPLTPEMRLIIEVSHLKNATPATVSRGGVLFVNETDVGWKPYIDTWMNSYKNVKKDEVAVTTFTLCLATYCNEQFMDANAQRETIAPICLMGNMQSLTNIIDYQYDQLSENKEMSDYIKSIRDNEDYAEKQKQIYEGFFCFAFMWAFGGILTDDKISFSASLKGTSKIKFPEVTGTQVFDFYFNPITQTFESWRDIVKPYDSEYEGLF